MIHFHMILVSLSLISNYSKFHEINQDTKVHPIIKKEKSINYYVNKYLKSYGSETVKNLIPKGSSPGKMYGLIKVHKKKIIIITQQDQ